MTDFLSSSQRPTFRHRKDSSVCHLFQSELFARKKIPCPTIGAWNKLDIKTGFIFLKMLIQGYSIRSISRSAGGAIDAVTNLIEDAGRPCVAYHDVTVRNGKAAQVQCDEIWSFSYAKN